MPAAVRSRAPPTGSHEPSLAAIGSHPAGNAPRPALPAAVCGAWSGTRGDSMAEIGKAAWFKDSENNGHRSPRCGGQGPRQSRRELERPAPGEVGHVLRRQDVVVCYTLTGWTSHSTWTFSMTRTRSRSMLKPRTCSSTRTSASTTSTTFGPTIRSSTPPPPAHYLMVAEVAGTVLVVPIAPSRSGDPSKCRPIGCYEASSGLAATHRRDRDEY